MSRHTPSRREFTILLGGALGAGLAGCAGPGGDGGTTTTTTSGGTTTGTTQDGTTGTQGGTTTETTGTTGTTTGMSAPETTDRPSPVVRDGQAVVRVAHLSPDVPAVDVYVAGQQVLSGVPFGTVGPYLILDPGTYAVRLVPSGGESAVFDRDLSVEAKAYTVAALGEVAGANQSFAVKTFVDTVKPPEEDTALVRLVHAAPDAPAVDVTVEGADQTLFDGVAFGEASDYASVPADDYTLQVRPDTASNDGDVVATFDVSPEGGTVVTAFAVGYLSPGDAPADEPFDLLLTVDSHGSGGGM